MLNQHVVTEFVLLLVFVLMVWRRVRRLRKIKDTYEMPVWVVILFPVLAILISITAIMRLTALSPQHFWSFAGIWLLFFLIFTVLSYLVVRHDTLVHLKETNQLAVPGKRMRIVYGGLFLYAVSTFVVILLDQQIYTNYYYQMVTIFIRAIISGVYFGMLGTYLVKHHLQQNENNNDR